MDNPNRKEFVRQPINLPDFRNFGVILRILLGVELGIALWTWWCGGFDKGFFSTSPNTILVEPVLLTVLIVLFAAAKKLLALSYRLGILLILALTLLTTLSWNVIFSDLLLFPNPHDPIRALVAATFICTIVLFYFNWRHRVLSPALSEARLAALQSRIRPHFLFNSLNTVLSLIRPDPRRAESVLENLADLFRALMADPRTLVPLERELALTRAYLEVESLRLEDRLKVGWHCDQAPMDASVPQLILQPLVENAIVHGIEPSSSAGEIQINIFPKGERLVMVVRNSCLADSAPSNRPGNHMALANIRERLDLQFDAESRMTHFTAGGEFVVQIEMPLKKI